MNQGRGSSPYLLLFAVVFTVLVGANAWLEQDLGRTTSQLEVVRGTVTTSRVEHAGRAPSAVLVVSYEHRGYRGTTTPALWGVQGHEQDSPTDLVRALPVGATAPVYVDVADPSRAFLARPGKQARRLWVAFVVCAAATLALLVRFVRRRPLARNG